MRRILLRLVVAAVMVAMVLVIVVPAFAAPGGGATVQEDPCYPLEDAATVEGTQCDRRVTTPSNNNNKNYSSHFTPDVQPDGGTVDQGAEHDIKQLCDIPAYDSCNVIYTPSGNVNGTYHIRDPI